MLKTKMKQIFVDLNPNLLFYYFTGVLGSIVSTLSLGKWFKKETDD